MSRSFSWFLGALVFFFGFGWMVVEVQAGERGGKGRRGEGKGSERKEEKKEEKEEARAELAQGVQEELEEFAQKQQERWSEHREKQVEGIGKIREDLKEEKLTALIAALQKFKEAQIENRKKFLAGQQERREEFLRSLAEKKHVSKERLDVALAKIEERYRERVAHFTKMEEEEANFLEGLTAGKRDFTVPELRKALQEFHERKRAENKEFRERMRESRKKD